MKPIFFLTLPLLLGASVLSSQAGAQSAAALAKVDVADMGIQTAREKKYPGSALKVLTNLRAGSNYSRQVVSLGLTRNRASLKFWAGGKTSKSRAATVLRVFGCNTDQSDTNLFCQPRR